MTAVPYLLALLMAKAEGDDDTAAELADVLGDEEHAVALLEMAEGGEGSEAKAFRKAAAHAPAGGVTVGGVHYTGGQFIPGDVMENATPEERAVVEGGGDPAGRPAVSDENKEVDPELASAWSGGEPATGYRIQAAGKPMPTRSADMWTESDEDDEDEDDEGERLMPGTSSYANLSNVIEDMVFGIRESVTGENYTKNVRDDGHEPELLVLFGDPVDAPGAETVVKNARVAARFSEGDVTNAFREAVAGYLEPGDEEMSVGDVLSNYEFDRRDLSDIMGAVEKILRQKATPA